ncbi:MAG: hypothetical protein COA78_31495 [Blastopirellula sp.]|nr:MAG: hypothetical protein COA78_31495 [Blastopirellula sp.]
MFQSINNLLLPLLCCLTFIYSSQALNAQTRVKVPDPRAFGFDIPPALVSYNVKGNVEVRDNDGKKVVGRIHVTVGTNLIIEMPDGTLVAKNVTELKKTDARFTGMAKKELEQRKREEFPSFKIRSSNHYVFVYNTTDEFANVTMRILESMVPGIMNHSKAQRIKVKSPDVPLVVIMFATQKQYAEYSDVPNGVVAFYDIKQNHVVMYEKPDRPPFKQEIYYRQAISTIAHEGAHQILHNIGVQQRLSRWPMWLSEGIAEYYAPTEFGKRLKWKGAGVINDMRMFELESYIKAKNAEQVDGQMVSQTVVAARLTSTGYASAWALTHYLATRKRSNFNAFIKEVSQLRPLEGAIEQSSNGTFESNKELFSKHFGEDFGELERDLVTHLKRQPYDHPFSEYAHFVSSIRIRSGKKYYGTADVFHSRELAIQWQQQQINKLTQEQQNTAQIELQIFVNRKVAESYATQWLRANR